MMAAVNAQLHHLARMMGGECVQMAEMGTGRRCAAVRVVLVVAVVVLVLILEGKCVK